MGEMFHFTKKDYRQGIAGQCIVYKNKVFLYQRKGAVFELEKTLPEADEYTILAVFDDNAPACASLAVNGKTAAPVAGYTSCGTGRVRRAAFLFKTEEALAGKITAEIYGMPGIRSLFVTPGKDESVISSAKADRAGTDEIHLSEEIKPLFELENKMQLIVSVGADAAERDGLENALESMREFCPLFRKLGFNGVESYVKWNFVEYEKGVFDWSFYDSVIEMAASYGMGWFPLIIGGSAYALPEWYREKTEGFTGFRCLEHGMDNNIPTIFNEHQTEHIINYLHAFGKHYEGNKNVFGVRLGPSGNYGESQYPASGNWGYKGEKEHMHLGWWAGDGDAAPKYAAWLKNKYWNEEKLSAAWGEIIENFGDVVTYIPSQAGNMRKRKDFTDWYMHEMTDWCNRWAVWMRGELKSHDIYQSAGGWGFCEAGTDFTDQARGMIAVNGGIRATNEDESYEL
ncbi:MAG: beta-galactosidase, partial [Oscillospiraceae bacterium]|nr:beta-galactosidase [Oscillospiraceae bacterium]